MLFHGVTKIYFFQETGVAFLSEMCHFPMKVTLSQTFINTLGA